MTDTSHITDETIRTAISTRIDPSDQDAPSIGQVRSLLDHLQDEFVGYWGEICDTIEQGSLSVEYDTGEVVVLHDENGYEWQEWLDAIGVDNEVLQSVLRGCHRIAQSEVSDVGYSDALVVKKPADAEAGQLLVECIVNGLQARGLSPGQAWAYYGVEIRRNSMKSWGTRKGDYDHKNVSDALKKAKQNLH